MRSTRHNSHPRYFFHETPAGQSQQASLCKIKKPNLALHKSVYYCVMHAAVICLEVAEDRDQVENKLKLCYCVRRYCDP